MSRSCPSCGSAVAPTDTVCPVCGEALSPIVEEAPTPAAPPPPPAPTEPVAAAAPKSAQRVCPECGARNPATATECASCGEPLSTERPAPAARKSAPVAAKGSPSTFYSLVALGAILLTVVIFVVSKPKETVGPPQTQSADPHDHGADPHAEGGTGGLPEGHPPMDGAAAKAQYEQQLARLQDSLKNNPDQDTIRLMIGNVLFDLERFGEAIPYLRDYLKKHPDDENNRINLGLAMAASGDLSGGEKEIGNVLVTSPRNQSAMVATALIYRARQSQETDAAQKQRQLEQELEWYRKAVAVDSTTFEGQRAKEMLDAMTTPPMMQ